MEQKRAEIARERQVVVSMIERYFSERDRYIDRAKKLREIDEKIETAVTWFG
jgi:hypothetical protein